MATAYGYGVATLETEGEEVLDVWFPEPRLTGEAGSSCIKTVKPPEGIAEILRSRDPLLNEARGVRQDVVFTRIDTDACPENTADAYLRLHVLSHRLMRPNTINLEGIFGLLINVVWTNFGPCPKAGFEETRLKLNRWAPVNVFGVDKFPRMADYVIPSDVRVADADRVRLGAHLAPGTTVMHEGFINFNAGTLGPSMVEGRISTGVVVGAGSDVGGGASIMGTLSGGGKERITIGERVLLGANSGVGISVGDDSVVEAGLYVTAGTRVRLRIGDDVRTVKAVELSGMSGLLFRRNSETGEVEALSRRGKKIALNQQLHAN